MRQEVIITLKRKRDKLQARLDQLDDVIIEVATSGYSSASISAGGGSKSYTRSDLSQLRALRTDLANQLARVDASLVGRSAIRHMITVRS